VKIPEGKVRREDPRIFIFGLLVLRDLVGAIFLFYDLINISFKRTFVF